MGAPPNTCEPRLCYGVRTSRYVRGNKGKAIPHQIRADIYADEYELRTVAKIIEAAIWYTTAEELEVDVYLKST